MSSIPFSQACENNKNVILDVIRDCFSTSNLVLEVGTGTAQHAVYFSQNLPHLTWQPSDQADYIEGIEAQLAFSRSASNRNSLKLEKLKDPLVLDVTLPWPIPVADSQSFSSIDAIFTANTLHIMAAEMVEAFFRGVGEHLKAKGNLCIYGPFNYEGSYTSESNAQFDIWLAQRDSRSAIRHFEWVVELARQHGLVIVSDFTMPANNRLLHFVKE